MSVAFLLYIAIVLSLIWGRFRFFRMDSGTGNFRALLYDASVALQILTTLYYMVAGPRPGSLIIISGCLLYFMSLLLFWWAVKSAKQLDFAYSDKAGSIVTTGPFRLVRHPFYTSYLMAWLASSLMFHSWILWITLLYLTVFYYLSARKEETVLSNGEYSEEYRKYLHSTGMFLPRIKRWSQ